MCLSCKSCLAFVYRYLVLNIADSPIENIIQYIPKVSVYCVLIKFLVSKNGVCVCLGNNVMGASKLVLAR